MPAYQWANSVQRRPHKERAQVGEKQKWGLLEKRKDYKLRAKDYREKKQKLRILKQKATDRNPDEFSYKMLSSTVDKAGRKVADRGNSSLNIDVAKLLKTQDANYIRTMLQMIRKEKEELEQRVMLSDKKIQTLGSKSKKAKHTAFVGDVDEQEDFDPEEWSSAGKPQVIVPELEEDEEQDEASRPKKLSKKQQDAQKLAEKEELSRESKRERTHERVLAHLKGLKTKEKDLMTAERELELQRAKMSGSIGGVNKSGVKYKIRERKR
ncbi:U3 snoRNP-associated protein-like protein Utp11 [Dendryphion nanum]|uniref:U3 small nucleolar RNA-associated protein 11 n=1 Tax=Dendryphion nanum TaxID=256645 RepID=A0A9P9D2V5_9PLEO|nr:U3 snoRNP-associated protein-like protein Utp11 [Dendryphion nanum]